MAKSETLNALSPFDKAHELIYHNDQKAALYALDEKLRRGLLPQ